MDELAALGPFFAVETHEPGADPALPWRPLAELAEPAGLQSRIDTIRGALAARSGDGASVGGIDLRVAASVTQLGLVARVVAPALAAQAMGQPLDLRLGGLLWQDTVGGPLPLSVPEPTAGAHGHPAGEPLGPPMATLFGEVITPITAATTGLAPVSDRVLWGNVASAVNGAAGQLARARPDLAAAAWAIAAAFFRDPRLGTEPGPPGPSFRRSSCCLIYRLAPGPGGPVCGDCVLAGRR